MFISELFNESVPQLVVIYPGRFQPFHQGHAAVFAQLQAKFGRDSVFIATSNKVELPKSPFNFSDKTVLMNAAGVPSDRILEVKNPYMLPPQFDPQNTILVVAVGAPDADRLRPDSFKKDGSEAYYKTLKSLREAVTADRHGYVVVVPEVHKAIVIDGKSYDVSHGTACRNLWNAIRNNPEQRAQFIEQLYGRSDPEVGQILDKISLSESRINEMSGVIATRAQANDPRYSMSLTKDVRPGQIEKNLRAFKLNAKAKR